MNKRLILALAICTLLFAVLVGAQQDVSLSKVKIPDYADVTATAAPANPPAGTQRWYANTTTGKMACITSAGADCNPATAGIGDVLGPATSTDGNIPQWNGTDNKTLKAGLAVASANTASAIVQRDASGNFSAGTVTANLTGDVTGNVTGNVTGTAGSATGNAATATALAANGGNCAGATFAKGVDASGVAECDTPAGGGDVVAPAANTDDIFPRWNGLNSKTLKDGTAAASANTVSTLVIRDASGNFAAGTITAALTGNASTATALAANGGNCSGGQFALGVSAAGVAECDTPVGSGDVLGPATNTADSIPQWNGPNSKTLKDGLVAASANTASALVQRDGSGNFSAGTVTAALTGNSSTATALAADPANCAAGTFPLGIEAAGTAEGCTALPTTIAGTANQVTASASTGAVTLSLAAAQLIRVCEIVVGDPGADSPALADDNDTVAVCGNKYGVTLTITAVECRAVTGAPTVTPIITGSGATSILTGALTCGTGSFTSGTLNGTPVQGANSSIDGNITTAGGTAKQIVIRITRTL